MGSVRSTRNVLSASGSSRLMVTLTLPSCSRSPASTPLDLCKLVPSLAAAGVLDIIEDEVLPGAGGLVDQADLFHKARVLLEPRGHVGVGDVGAGHPLLEVLRGLLATRLFEEDARRLRKVVIDEPLGALDVLVQGVQLLFLAAPTWDVKAGRSVLIPPVSGE